MDCLHGLLSWPFFLSYLVFVFSFPDFFVSVLCARLGWPSRQLLSARNSTASYRIVSVSTIHRHLSAHYHTLSTLTGVRGTCIGELAHRKWRLFPHESGGGSIGDLLWNHCIELPSPWRCSFGNRQCRSEKLVKHTVCLCVNHSIMCKQCIQFTAFV